jgi:hypothetical protein
VCTLFNRLKKSLPAHASVLIGLERFGEIEPEPTPSPNIHIFLPSGIAVIGIDPWVERFTKIYQNVGQDQKSGITDLAITNIRSQPPNFIPIQY